MRLIPVLLLLLAFPAAALAAAPAATTTAASGVTRSAAALNGTVDPNGKATSYHFEYGTTTAYGLTSAGGDAGAGEDPVAVSVPVAGLSAGTTYHYRIVASNEDGDVTGADRTFRTASGPALPGNPELPPALRSHRARRRQWQPSSSVRCRHPQRFVRLESADALSAPAVERLMEAYQISRRELLDYLRRVAEMRAMAKN